MDKVFGCVVLFVTGARMLAFFSSSPSPPVFGRLNLDIMMCYVTNEVSVLLRLYFEPPITYYRQTQYAVRSM